MKKNDNKQQEKLLNSLNYRFVDDLKTLPVSMDLNENERLLEAMFEDCSDFVIRQFQLEHSVRAILFLSMAW